MVDAIFLVTRTVQGVNDDKNKVREVIFFNDDGDSDLLIAQNLVDILNTNTPRGDGRPCPTSRGLPTPARRSRASRSPPSAAGQSAWGSARRAH